MATFMVIPTSIITIYIFIKEKNGRESNLTLMSWVFMNIFWMLHELHNLPFWPVQIFMLLGIFSTFRLMFKGRKNEGNIS
jgi:hypothetical protein